MEKVSLLVDNRNSTGGKSGAKRLRNEGVTPGILYQDGESYPIQAPSKDLNQILKQHGANAILELAHEGKQKQAFIKEVQRDPVNHELLHFDLQPIAMNETIQVNIPIQIEGQKRVEGKGGILQRQMHEIEIEALPQDIPRFIEVDISNMNIGEVMQVGDVEIAKELTLLSDPQETVLSVTEAGLGTDEGEEELQEIETK